MRTRKGGGECGVWLCGGAADDSSFTTQLRQQQQMPWGTGWCAHATQILQGRALTGAQGRAAHSCFVVNRFAGGTSPVARTHTIVVPPFDAELLAG